MWSTVLFYIGVFLITLQLFKTLRIPPRSKLPPGPMGLPIIGNLLQLPTSRPWLVFDEWIKQYGPIIYLNIAGQNTIVLGTHKAAADLLDRRANIYSDRPYFVVFNLLTGGMHWAWTQADELWRKKRRGAHEALNAQAAKEYFPYQETESVIMLDQLLAHPENFTDHFQRASTSLTLTIVYGWPPLLDSTHPNVVHIDRMDHELLVAAAPGSFWVEFKYFRWMKYLPRWMCAWRRNAEDAFSRNSVMLEGLSADVQKQMDAGDNITCVASKILQNTGNLFEASWNSISIYTAGAETVNLLSRRSQCLLWLY